MKYTQGHHKFHLAEYGVYVRPFDLCWTSVLDLPDSPIIAVNAPTDKVYIRHSLGNQTLPYKVRGFGVMFLVCVCTLLQNLFGERYPSIGLTRFPLPGKDGSISMTLCTV